MAMLLFLLFLRSIEFFQDFLHRFSLSFLVFSAFDRDYQALIWHLSLCQRCIPVIIRSAEGISKVRIRYADQGTFVDRES